MFFGFDWDERHGRSGGDFGDRLRIAVVILVNLYIRSDIQQRHQSGLLPIFEAEAPDVMCAPASLHCVNTT